jgi:hypothetical protein
MSYAAEYSELAGAFSTGWKTTVVAPAVAEVLTPIAWPNVAFTPPVASSWVRFNILPSGSNLMTVGAPGNNLTRYSGIVVVQIFTPLNTDDSALLAYADKVLAIFRNYHTTTIRFGSIYSVKTSNSEEDGWNQINVMAPFIRNEYE